MHNKLLKSLAFVSASVVMVSCSLFSERVYNRLESTKENTGMNYCLLINRNNHSDSIERTRSTREVFLVNMVTTTDADTFVKAIVDKVGKQNGIYVPSGGWDNFAQRLDVPLLFWNKQPQKVDSTLDTDHMNNRYFKYIYYVGVDAADGGTKQGELIEEYLNQRYVESILNQRGEKL